MTKKFFRLTELSVFALACGLFLAASTAARAGGDKADPSAAFFAGTSVARFEIELAPEALPVLRRDPHEYVRATIREGGTNYAEVGLHLKGGLGTFAPIDEKPSFTLNFDKFKRDQKFRGMDKIHLNNAAEDPSFLHEYLAGELFRKAGVPAPRVAFARVSLNGRDLGMYVFKEGFDATFLKHHFKDASGVVFDPGLSHDIHELAPKKSRKGEKPAGDLQALWAAAHEADLTKRFARMGETLDLERFAKFIAMEALVGHDDGYMINKNNYRVYFDPGTKRFVFMPTGMDQVFAAECPFEANGVGHLAQAFVDTPAGKRMYEETFEKLFRSKWDVRELEATTRRLQKVIRTALVKDELKDHNAAIKNLLAMIAAQTKRIEAELAAWKTRGK